MSILAIVGAGLMGTATAWPLSDNGHQVRLVGTHLDTEIIQSCKENHYHPRLKRKLPEGVQPYFIDEIGEALRDAEIIISGVSSPGAHWIGRVIATHLQPGQKIIAVTKGLEATPDGELRLLPDVLYSELPTGLRDQVSLAAIGGPCIAGELAGRRPTHVVFASRSAESVDALAQAFRTPYYRVRTTTDLLSLELSAALKNAYTLGVGLAAGLMEQAGGPDETGMIMDNLASALFAQGTLEIYHWLEVMGADPSFAHHLPGVGDLFVTVQGGRTVRLGRLLGMGKSFAEARQIMAGETLESAEIVAQIGIALPQMQARGQITPTDFPLLRLLVDLVVNGRRAGLPIERYLSILTV